MMIFRIFHNSTSNDERVKIVLEQQPAACPASEPRIALSLPFPILPSAPSSLPPNIRNSLVLTVPIKLAGSYSLFASPWLSLETMGDTENGMAFSLRLDRTGVCGFLFSLLYLLKNGWRPPWVLIACMRGWSFYADYDLPELALYLPSS